MGTRDVGWDIVRLALRYGMDDRLVITANTPGLPHIPTDRLNLIYNACDVGINTSLGEGWGLTSWEHAATGKPQILPRHSALPEIWGDSAIWVPTIADYQYEGTHTIGRITSLEDTVKALEFAYNDWLNGSKVLNELSKKCLEIVRRPEYRWENIAKRFESIFEEVNDNVAE
jgi:glycosyltransferase involved in cell wall biosynthesis